MNGEKGFGFCFVETESHAAQAGPKLIMESRKILKLFQILSLIVGLQACPITLAHFIIFHVCILGGVSMSHDTHVEARGQLSKVSSPFTYVSPRIEFKSGLASCCPYPIKVLF